MAIIVFVVMVLLVGLNAYQRDQQERDIAISPNSLGPGATQAAEISFPTKTPTAESHVTYTPVSQIPQAVPLAVPQQQYAVVPMLQVRPSEPALQYMAVPMGNGAEGVRLKRVVGR